MSTNWGFHINWELSVTKYCGTVSKAFTYEYIYILPLMCLFEYLGIQSYYEKPVTYAVNIRKFMKMWIKPI